MMKNGDAGIFPVYYSLNRSISIFLGMVVGTSWNIRTGSKELRISAILFLFIQYPNMGTTLRHVQSTTKTYFIEKSFRHLQFYKLLVIQRKIKRA